MDSPEVVSMCRDCDKYLDSGRGYTQRRWLDNRRSSERVWLCKECYVESEKHITNEELDAMVKQMLKPPITEEEIREILYPKKGVVQCTKDAIVAIKKLLIRR